MSRVVVSRKISGTLRRFVPALMVVLAAPAAAWACPVCALAGTADNRGAYVATTALLSAVPLAMIGSITLWIVRRARRNRA